MDTNKQARTFNALCCLCTELGLSYRHRLVLLWKVLVFKLEEAVVQCGGLSLVIMISEDNCDRLVMQQA